MKFALRLVENAFFKLKNKDFVIIITLLLLTWLNCRFLILQRVTILYLGLDVRNPVFGGMQTTQVQTSLRIRAV